MCESGGESEEAGSDESIEARDRSDDQQTGDFGGGMTNVGNPDDSKGYSSAQAGADYNKAQKDLANRVATGQKDLGLGFFSPTPDTIQSFREEQENIDVLGYDPTQESIDVGPGDIFGLEDRIAENLRQGGKPSFNPQGNIIGSTGYGPAFGGMSILSGMLPDVTTYTGLREGDPFNQDDPYSFNDGNNEPELIRRRMSAETVPIEEEVDPALSDDLAINYLQNPNFLYSGQGNLYQPYGYANNTLVDLLRTRNMTQPQQAASNLGLFGNPGDFS